MTTVTEAGYVEMRIAKAVGLAACKRWTRGPATR
jgi:hypothetical protein